jgi:hypothetical protein
LPPYSPVKDANYLTLCVESLWILIWERRGVAAGFAPLSLGTETDGSITQPAGRNSLYGLKVTVGAVSTAGTSPYSSFSDSVGAMAKTPNDLAKITGVLMKQDFSADRVSTWEGQKVAFVDQTDWPSSPVATVRVPVVVDKQVSINSLALDTDLTVVGIRPCCSCHTDQKPWSKSCNGCQASNLQRLSN